MEAARDSRIVKLETFRALRAKLAEPPAPPPHEGVAVGVPGFDEATGGLRKGAVSEFSGSSGHGMLFFSALLETACRERWHLGLIDAADQFEPADWDATALRRVLWVRCREARKALRAADLLLRDGNLPLLVLDLQGVPAAQLSRIPPNVWHRFQRVVEEAGVAFVVLSRRPTVEGAHVRIEVEGGLRLDAMRVKRRDLAARMPVRTRQKVWDAARRSA